MFDRRDGRDAAPGKQHRHDQARTGRGHTEAEANAAARRDPGRETLAPALTGSAAICTACLRNVLLETATLRDQLPVLEAALRDRAVVRDEVLTRTRARLQASDRMMAVAREHKGVTLSPIINALWDRAVREREAVRPRVLALLATQAVRSGHSTASGAAPRGADRRWADAAGRLAALTERGDQSAANPHVAAATAARADRASSDDLHQAYAAPIAQAAAGAVGPHASQPGSSVASVATVPAGTAAPTMSAPPAVAPPAKEPLEAPRLHDLPTGATKYAVRHESSKVALGRGTSLVVRLEGGLQDKQVELTMPAGPARIDVGAQEVIRTTNDHATRIATSLLKAGGKIVDGMSVAGYPITLSLETKLLEGDVLDPGKLTLGQVALKGSVDASAIDGRLYGKFEVVVTIKLTAADLAELAKARAAAKTLQHADDLVRHAKELEARVAKQQAALAKTRVGTRAHKELKDRLSRTRQLLDTAKRRMNQARKASTSAARALSRSASKLAKSALGKLAGKALTTAFKRFIPFYNAYSMGKDLLELAQFLMAINFDRMFEGGTSAPGDVPADASTGVAGPPASDRGTSDDEAGAETPIQTLPPPNDAFDDEKVTLHPSAAALMDVLVPRAKGAKASPLSAEDQRALNALVPTGMSAADLELVRTALRALVVTEPTANRDVTEAVAAALQAAAEHRETTAAATPTPAPAATRPVAMPTKVPARDTAPRMSSPRQETTQEPLDLIAVLQVEVPKARAKAEAEARAKATQSRPELPEASLDFVVGGVTFTGSYLTWIPLTVEPSTTIRHQVTLSASKAVVIRDGAGTVTLKAGRQVRINLETLATSPK